MISLKKLCMAGIAAAVILPAVWGTWGCAQKTEPISIGIWPNEINTLIYIAQDQGYFAGEGLDATFKDYTSVANGVDGMLKGETDISIGSEFLLAGKVFAGEDIRALASIDQVLQVAIVARQDRGIKSIADLKGKTIGVFKGAATEFYLGRTLELNGMRINQVTMLDTAALNIVDIFRDGKVDAVITGQPNIARIKSQMGGEVIVWPAQSSQSTFYNILCTGTWAAENPEKIKRLMKSLDRAERYIITDKDKARAIIQKKLGYSEEYVTDVWPDHRFLLSIYQVLIAAMEDEARWMIANNITAAKTVPDFLKYISFDGLKGVKPEAVKIIR